jgi:hypothetical protein
MSKYYRGLWGFWRHFGDIYGDFGYINRDISGDF